MKNAMKKLMSLVLVAVMLLSAVPFQAAAEDAATFSLKIVAKENNEIVFETTIDTTGGYTAQQYFDVWVAGSVSEGAEFDYDKGPAKLNGTVQALDYLITTADATEGSAALGFFVKTTVEEEQDYCTICDGVQGSDHAHDYCTICDGVQGSDHAHDYCTACAGVQNAPHAQHCGDCGSPDHATGSTACSNYDYCAKCTGKQDANHAHCADCDSPDHATGNANCPAKAPVTYSIKFVGVDGALVDTKTVSGGKVTAPTAPFVNGYDFKGWLFNGAYYDAGDSIAVGNQNLTISAVYVDTDPTQYYTINVYARKYVGGSLKETQQIWHYEYMQKGDNVLDYLKSIQGDLRTQVYARFPGCDWTGHFYNYYGNQVATDNVTTTNGAKNIYINVYSQNESDVLVYVHTTSSSTYDSLIEMTGYEEDETITYSAVLAAVKEKYYGTNLSMTMYDEDGWADYRNGKSNTSTKGVEVHGNGTTKIHVIVKNASTYNANANADSSNPKTGDTIYMAITAMAVSASALALFVFLNKKRAVK